MELRRVVIGVDFSESGERAVEHGRAIAIRSGAHALVVHACRFPEPTETPRKGESSALAKLRAAERVDHQSRLTELQSVLQGQDVSASALMADGDADLRLTEEGDNADLLVVGHRGTTGVERLLVGSVAETVAARSRGPVLIARGRGVLAGYGHVVVADDRRDDAHGALEWADLLAGDRGNVTLLHVAESPLFGLDAGNASVIDRLTRELDEAAADALAADAEAASRVHSRSVKPLFLPGTPRDVLAAVFDTRHVDLVVVARRGRRRIGALSHWIVRHAPCSVLVVPGELSRQQHRR